MYLRARLLAACTILAAFAAGPSVAAPAALTSFGSTLSAGDLAALAIHAPGAAQQAQLQLSGFAASQALTETLAFDTGYRLDTGARFASFDLGPNPLRDTGSFLALADNGRYAGLTFAPAPELGLRLGFSNWNGRIDNAAMDGVAFGVPAVYDTAQVNSMLAGVRWNFNEWIGLGVNAISSFRSGLPLGYAGNLAPLAESATTQAVQISASLSFGNNWVTTAEFGHGMTQMRQRDGAAASLDAQTFAITVAKRGIFGDDALGVSLSRPAPGSFGGFGSLASTGNELPPVMTAVAGRAPETDFQLGYVTSFMGGKLALQTNAAYQVNPQGQSGASAVSLLSRAKIKF